MRTKNQNFSTKMIEEVEVIAYQEIYIFRFNVQRIAAWYHEYLAHPGESQTEATTRHTCTWPKLRSHVETFCKTSCCTCHFLKTTVKILTLTTRESRRTSIVLCQHRLDWIIHCMDSKGYAYNPCVDFD